MAENREVIKRTLGQALQIAGSNGASMFSEYLEKAESRGIPLSQLFKEQREADYTSKIDVITYRLIGGNGAGKTERGVADMVEAVKREGLNPVVFKKGVYPKDPERDVLICHINCTGRDETYFLGIPYNKLVDVPLVDEEGVPQYDEHGNIKMQKVEQLNYSGNDELQAAAMFPFSVFIFDEANRATAGAQALLAGLYGGERISGIRLSRGASLVVATQNAEDGINMVRPADAATRSKTITMPVRFSVDEYKEWAVQKGLHPAVIVFAEKHRDLFENFKDSDVRELAPLTSRGLTRMSNFLYRLEKEEEKHIENGRPELVRTREEVMDVVSYFAQGSMGSHPNSEQPLSEDFAVLYADEIRSVLPAVKHVYKNPKVELGISGEFPIAFDLLNQTESLRQHIPEKERQRIADYTALESAAASNRIDAFGLYMIKELNEILNSTDRFWLRTAARYENEKEIYEEARSFLSGMSDKDYVKWAQSPAAVKYTSGFVGKKLDEHDLNVIASRIAASAGMKGFEKVTGQKLPAHIKPKYDISQISNLDKREKQHLIHRLREAVTEKDDQFAKQVVSAMAMALTLKFVAATSTVSPSKWSVMAEQIKRAGESWDEENQWYPMLKHVLSSVVASRKQNILESLVSNTRSQMATNSAIAKMEGMSQSQYDAIYANMAARRVQDMEDASLEGFNNEEPEDDFNLS